MKTLPTFGPWNADESSRTCLRRRVDGSTNVLDFALADVRAAGAFEEHLSRGRGLYERHYLASAKIGRHQVTRGYTELGD